MSQQTARVLAQEAAQCQWSRGLGVHKRQGARAMPWGGRGARGEKLEALVESELLAVRTLAVGRWLREGAVVQLHVAGSSAERGGRVDPPDLLYMGGLGLTGPRREQRRPGLGTEEPRS